LHKGKQLPQIDFAPEHKAETRQEFDRLKLKRDERARIACLEKPTFAWVHTLKAPKIVNGEAVKVQRERSNGDKYTDFDNDFIGRPLCLGDYGTIAEKSVDPANCPACEASTLSDQVKAPERRFAMNVIRYNTNRDGKVSMGGTCLVWSFTDKVYNKLVDIATEYGSLRDHDLMLGPCISEPFQTYEIMPAMQAAWQQNEQLKQVVLQTYNDNRVKELEAACGRNQQKHFMQDDLKKIADRWDVANGVTAVSPTDRVDSASLADSMADLLDTGKEATKPVDEAATPAVSSTSDGSTAASTTAPKEALDFDALMQELG
jgi:hypothetical protein